MRLVASVLAAMFLLCGRLSAAEPICAPGHTMVDYSKTVSAETNFADLVVIVEPRTAQVFVYEPGHIDEHQTCCGGRQNGVVRMPMRERKLCVGQSQDRMKWQLLLKPQADL
jgi:hypothetical protein